jgi:hypothetical protein
VAPAMFIGMVSRALNYSPIALTSMFARTWHRHFGCQRKAYEQQSTWSAARSDSTIGW